MVSWWWSRKEGLGFRGPRQGIRGLRRLRRQTKGCGGFPEQGHQAKAERIVTRRKPSKQIPLRLSVHQATHPYSNIQHPHSLPLL